MKQLLVASFVMIVGFSFMLVFATQVGAVDIIGESCKGGVSSELCQADKENIETDGTIKTIVDVLMFLLGVVAVISIIIGGIIYVTSNGDSSKLTQAKNIILYAVIGLIVALMSWGIVRFILEQF